MQKTQLIENDLYNKNKKFKDLIDTGRVMVFKYGHKRITIEEICEKADVSKVTFYKFFRNKEDFIITLLQIWMDQVYEEYREIMKSDVPFQEKAEASFNYKMKISDEYSNEFLDEIMGENASIIDFFQEQRSKFAKLDLKMLRQGQKEGTISSDIAPEFFIYLMELARSAFLDEKLKSIYPDLHIRIRQVMNFFYFGLAKREGEKHPLA